MLWLAVTAHGLDPTVIRAGSGIQIFSTIGSSGEPNPGVCGLIGGTGRYLQFRAATNGTVKLDTIGSNFDTIISVFKGTNILFWQLVACDNNGAPDGIRSLVTFPVTTGEQFTVAIDGVNGSPGVAQFNFCLGNPPQFLIQPQKQTVAAGADVSFFVWAESVTPQTYQWRLNGANLPGETNVTLQLTNVQMTHSGMYNVVVVNDCLSASSQAAALVVTGATVTLTDSFADRVVLSESTGLGAASNVLATLEAGEPFHAGILGGKSVWMGWRAPTDGIVEFQTQGSDFDTLLALYSGTTLGNLTVVDADDDSGGFGTSKVRGRVTADSEYAVAVDGYFGRSGRIVLGWTFQVSSNAIAIETHPADRAVVFGSNATFTVGALGHGLGYEWLFNETTIVGAVSPSLIVSNAQAEHVGLYSVRVTNQAGASVVSRPARLEVVSAPAPLSVDKLEQLGGASLRLGGIIGVSAGTIGSHILSSANSGSDPGETNHCAGLGGASRWLLIRTDSWGSMSINTEGSTVPTILAAYTGVNPTNLQWHLVDCNRSQSNNVSSIRFDAQAGVEYSLAVDTLKGVTGTVRVNWSFGPPQADHYRLANLGDPVSFDSKTTNGLTTYQWLLNGQPIINATNSAISVPNAQPASAGVYSITISNSLGVLTRFQGVLNVAESIQLGWTPLGNGMALRLTGVESQALVLQESTDLLQWTTVWTNYIPNIPFDFVQQTGSPRGRFYRLKQWP
jgi:Ig-like domain-containing protein